MKNKVRFAPSPTGFLHLGNARMAVLNSFLIQKIGGDYILRIDDTDFSRVKEEYINGIREDLTWLGITWQEEFKQSDRIDLYNNFLKNLKQEEKVYPCYETKEELEYKKKIQLAKGKPPIYDRSMLKITSEQKSAYEKEGRKPYYRLKIDYGDISWVDLVKGKISFKGEHISDPVIVRENGSFLYLLTSVLDDFDKGITHILRGEDHVVNTAVQVQLFEYLKADVPKLAHLPLITNKEGAGFSKREGSLSLRSLRENGMLPIALNNYLFNLGIGEQNIFYNSVEEIIKEFDLGRYNSASAKFDESKLLRLNLQALHALDFFQAKTIVNQYLGLEITESFWDIIKHNIKVFADIKHWWEICYNEKLNIEYQLNQELLDIVIKTIPTEEFLQDTWQDWLQCIKKESSLKGKALFEPIRMMFSGQIKGPELKDLIVLIGREKLLSRLKSLQK